MKYIIFYYLYLCNIKECVKSQSGDTHWIITMHSPWLAIYRFLFFSLSLAHTTWMLKTAVSQNKVKDRHVIGPGFV